MKNMRRKLAVAIGVSAVVSSFTVIPQAKADTIITLTGCCTPQTGAKQVESAADGHYYVVQSNEWGSSASPFSITSDLSSASPNLTVATNVLANATNGAPGAYPSIFMGKEGGYTTHANQLGGETVGNLTSGENVVDAGYTANTSNVVSGSAWDSAYDIWFDNTLGGYHGDGSSHTYEMMIWLNSQGGVTPAGSDKNSSGATVTTVIGGITYDVYWDPHDGVLTFDSKTALSKLNTSLQSFVSYAHSQDSLNSTWYLYNVSAGFEIWQHGQGLQATAFSVSESQ
jgi:hypothetical protein